jgi:hypothetical protein
MVLASSSANKQIALHLGISVRTVEVHRARMMKRLGVHQLSEAIRLFVLANSVAIASLLIIPLVLLLGAPRPNRLPAAAG